MSKSFEIKGYINNVLKEIGLEGADAFDKALLLNALGKLEAAEHSDEYKGIIAGELEKLIHDNTISMGENDLVNFMYGNACYSVGKNETAVNIAKQTETQPRNEAGYFTDNSGIKCLCTAFKALSFYMNYETKDGGKEQYNDVIAQYNAMNDELFATAKYSKDTDKALRSLSIYAAALIDTMEVMDQMIYEIYRKMQDYYKASVKAVLEAGYGVDGFEDMDDETELMFAYAVLKGCRMKAVHTEKYEGTVLGVCDKVMSGEIFTDEDDKADDNIVSMAALVYSETVRNREYQDYGRGKGGALWS